MKIDQLIEIVSKGGKVRTGVNVYNKRGALLLGKDVLVDNENPLIAIKEHGVYDLEIDPETKGGVWDQTDQAVSLKPDEEIQFSDEQPLEIDDVEIRIRYIEEVRKEAENKYRNAKANIKKAIFHMKENGGRFDVELVEDTVSDIFNFLQQENTGFSCLTKDIFSYDDYLYSHSVNVCTVGTAILNYFNDHFSKIVNNYFSSLSLGEIATEDMGDGKFYIHYQPSELRDMSMGYFLHDVGKVMIPDGILNKEGPLEPHEFEIVKTHSYEKGRYVLKKSDIKNAIVENIMVNHHGPLFNGEQRCYPSYMLPIEVPPYVKIAKLADIYDAMTSKRCYKDAFNPINVVTSIFRTYAKKDPFLKIILHSFVKVIGIYPPGSILVLRNGQMGFVLVSEGPIIIPFTDTDGNPLSNKPDPIDLGRVDIELSPEIQVDKRRPLMAPTEVFDLLPSYIRELLQIEA